MYRLIGLTGRAGAGKDTAAEALVAAGYQRDAFADRMRAALLALDPMVDTMRAGARGEVVPLRLSWLVETCGWDAAKRNHPEIRRLLQRFGTEAGRDIHGPDCWVDLLMRDWMRAGRPRTVVTDVRFDNEAAAILDQGGVVLEVVRPGLGELPGGHPSEQGVRPGLVDLELANDGSVADLHRRVLEAVGA